MAPDTCNTPVQWDIDGAQKKFDKLTLGTNPSKNLQNVAVKQQEMLAFFNCPTLM